MQLRIAVEAEFTPYGPVEGLDQEVGEKERPRLLGQPPLDPIRAGEQVVAVQPRQARDPVPLADRVEGPIGAAIGIPDNDFFVCRDQPRKAPVWIRCSLSLDSLNQRVGLHRGQSREVGRACGSNPASHC